MNTFQTIRKEKLSQSRKFGMMTSYDICSVVTDSTSEVLAAPHLDQVHLVVNELIIQPDTRHRCKLFPWRHTSRKNCDDS